MSDEHLRGEELSTELTHPMISKKRSTKKSKGPKKSIHKKSKKVKKSNKRKSKKKSSKSKKK